MLRQTKTAQALAERLGEHAAVTTVRYPGFGGLLSFDVADGSAARLVETGDEDNHERDEPRRRHLHDGDPLPLGRSTGSAGPASAQVGLEPVESLWADLEQALARI